MSLVKDDLITSNFQVYPFESYIRIAKVKQVNLFSKEMIVQYVDGATDEFGEFIEGPEVVECIVGSNAPETTYAPSGAVHGRGDMIAVLVLADGNKYAVSSMDLYNNVNRENFALIGGWALYDVLSGLLVDFLDDTTTPEDSYLTFRRDFGVGAPYAYFTVTKITGDPTKRHIMRRMLDYFGSMQTQQMNITSVDSLTWQYTGDVGPDNNPMRMIHGRMHKGKRVCGFPYVEDIDYTNDEATLANDMTVYHSTLTGLKTAEIHPLSDGDVLRRYFERATVVWFNDEEPTHVLLIGSYPAWDVCQYIVFAEVPVYCLTGRKFLEREVLDEDLETERPGDILQSWQKYADQIRILQWIDRSTYVDFPAHESDIEFSDRLQKSVVAFLPTQPEAAIKDFGIHDGYGWGQGGTVFDVNKVKKIVGTIERTERSTFEAPEPNGSMYDYEILHNDPLTTGNLDLSYSTRFEYFHDSGETPPTWERQTPNNTAKEYSNWTDGVNYIEKTIDFDYYCEGWYDDTDPIYGRIGWSDGGGLWASNSQNFDNEYWHHTYRNGGHLFTNNFWLTKTGNVFEGGDTKYILMYADVEYDLFVFTKIETHIDSHAGLGPSWTFLEPLGTHWQRHSGVVMFEGTEWTIWTYLIPLVVFPIIYNFHPWLSDVGSPDRPDTPPCAAYASDTDHTGYFWHEPSFYYLNGTLKPGYSTAGVGHPGPVFGPASTGMWQVIRTDDTPASFADPDDLLQVSIDYDNDSFVVRWESFYISDAPNSKVLTYPNGGMTLYSFLGETPHFTDQVVTDLIEL